MKEIPMNQFLLIFRGGAITQKGVAPQQLQEHLAKWSAWHAQLEKSGSIQGGNPLENTGRTIRGSKKAVTDGPFTEAKDLLSGYILIEAKDLNQATQIALECPIYEYDGSVEVRPVLSMKR
jgi:hypothetical protein